MGFLHRSASIALVLSIAISCKEEEPPPPEVTVTFTSVTTVVDFTAVSLSVSTAVINGPITESGFLFGENPSLTLASSEKLPSASSTPIQVTKTGLTPGKLYYARPYALVGEESFVGDEISFTTLKPTYTSVTPLTAGRGQRVTITGNFITNSVDQVKLQINGADAAIITYSNTSLTFLVPETAAFGPNATISLVIATHNLNVTEKLTISRWSILANVPSPNSFQGPIASDINYNFMHDNVAYHFTSFRAYVYTMSTDSWVQNDAIGNAESLSYPVSFKIGNKGYAGLFGADKSLKQFDFTTKTWTSAGTFPGEVRNFYYGVSSASGDKGYYGLGYVDQSGAPPAGKLEFWEFNSSNNQWTARKDYVGATIGYGVSFSIDGRVFAGLGRNIESATYLPKFYAYTASENTWTEVADYPGPFTTFMKGFALGNKGFVIVKNEIWVYDYDTNQWNLYPDRIPGSDVRSNPTVFVGSNFFMVGAGVGSTTINGDFYKLYPY